MAKAATKPAARKRTTRKPIEFEDPIEAEVVEETALVNQEQAAAPAAVTTPLDLINQMGSQGVNVEQMTQLFELQLRFEENEAKKAFHKAFAAFKAEAIEIVKDKRVHYTSQKGTTDYNHATLGNWMRTVVPAMAKYGLSHYWETETTEDGKMKVACVICHEDGYTKQFPPMAAASDTSGGKNGIQGLGSAKSYLERYTFAAAVGLAASESEDDDGQTAEGLDYETISADQLADLEALVDEVKDDPKAICAWYKIKQLGDLALSDYDQLVTNLENKRG